MLLLVAASGFAAAAPPLAPLASSSGRGARLSHAPPAELVPLAAAER
jgi:hypothetical protein